MALGQEIDIGQILVLVDVMGTRTRGHPLMEHMEGVAQILERFGQALLYVGELAGHQCQLAQQEVQVLVHVDHVLLGLLHLAAQSHHRGQGAVDVAIEKASSRAGKWKNSLRELRRQCIDFGFTLAAGYSFDKEGKLNRSHSLMIYIMFLSKLS